MAHFYNYHGNAEKLRVFVLKKNHLGIRIGVYYASVGTWGFVIGEALILK